MGNVVDILFALLRFEICGSKLTKKTLDSITPEILPELLTISKKHDLAHLVGHALYRNGLIFKDDERYEAFEKLLYMAVFRYESQNYEFERICNTLEQNKISFIPLKGLVLRQYYPEPWMRTSCDIDILVKPCDLNRAIKVLINSLKYTVGKRDFHDITLYSPSGIALELHFDTVEEGRANNAKEVLASIWESAVCKKNSFNYSMSDEMFYFYHIAHMAKHFEIGGCGIRTFLDLWVLQKNRKDNNSLLEVGGLLKFAAAATKLCNVWFSGERATQLSTELEEYILNGGIYGYMKNRVLVGQIKMGGKFKYIINRVFLPYNSLKYIYPIIQSKPWLTAVFEVVRWFKLLVNGRIKSSLSELSTNNSLTKEQSDSISDLLDNLGL